MIAWAGSLASASARQFAALGLVLGALAVGVFSGSLASIDRAIGDLRFDTRSFAVNNDIVFVAMDSTSISDIGQWPWPRSLYGQLIDNALDAGAYDIVFDVDFSSLSTPAEDDAFEAALERAGGYVYLAAFNQPQPDGSTRHTLPAGRFLQFADVVAVNVAMDAAGIARQSPYAISSGERIIPSLAGLALRSEPSAPLVTIDYAIRADTIATVPAIDLIEGRVDPAALEGKRLIVGASALELQDFFISPNQGVLPGAVVQILAMETVALDRDVRTSGPIPGLFALACFLALMAVAGRKLPLWFACLAAATAGAAGELAGLLAFGEHAIQLETALLHTGLVTFTIWRVLSENHVRHFIIRRLTGERDHMRSILDRVVADNFDGVIIVGSDRCILSASALADDWLGPGLVGRSIETSLPSVLVRDIAQSFEETPASSRNASIMREAVIAMPGGPCVIEYVVTVSHAVAPNRVTAPSAFACLTFRDVTARRANEDRLTYLAQHDDLTGAYTRGHFLKLLDRAMDAMPSTGRMHVLVLNLKRFKSVNATLGHHAGDEMLRQVVTRLRTAGHRNIARLGADNFAFFFASEAEQTSLDYVFEAVVGTLTRPFDLDDHRATIGVAGGWATAAASTIDAETLIRRADMALATARDMPGNGVALYSDDMDTTVKERRTLEIEMREALETDQFVLVYQPQINLDHKRILGAEALLRWEHPQRGTVAPLVFLPVAEETGLIADIGRMVLHRACSDAARWPGDIQVAVNVSPLQFELCDIHDDVVAALGASGLPAHRLELEITEGTLLRHQDSAIETLRRLSALGVRIAIDDFGTGFSSLAYLSRLPFDVLKIDKSFVDAMFVSEAALQIVETIIQLGNQLNKCVLAEGVETEHQADALHAMGCKASQGYYHGRPGHPDLIGDMAMHVADMEAEVSDRPDVRMTG